MTDKKGPGGRQLCTKCGTEEGVHGGCDCGYLAAWKPPLANLDASCERKMPDFDPGIDKIIAEVEAEASELKMLRNFYNEVGAAVANEGPHTVEHLLATSALGKQTTIIGRERLKALMREVACDDGELRWYEPLGDLWVRCQPGKWLPCPTPPVPP